MNLVLNYLFFFCRIGVRHRNLGFPHMCFLTACGKFRRDGVSHFAEKLEAGTVAVQLDVADSLCFFLFLLWLGHGI